MPELLVDRVNIEIAGVLAEPAVVERVRSIGNIPIPTSPKEFKARIAADIKNGAPWSRARTSSGSNA